jgi:hypothetical protein
MLNFNLAELEAKTEFSTLGEYCGGQHENTESHPLVLFCILLLLYSLSRVHIYARTTTTSGGKSLLEQCQLA